MVILIKLGGSLITDKNQQAAYRPEVVARLAETIKQIVDDLPERRLILGHGSGSFGHYEAKAYGTIHGVDTAEQWQGFARVATVAAQLNHHVAQQLQLAGVPIMRFQPSASVHAEDGRISSMALYPLRQAIHNGIVPLVYGDVAFDIVRGGTIISTETIFTYLAHYLPVKRIVLLGEVDGVYDQNGDVVTLITPNRFDAIKSALGNSAGVDVTGGMWSKVTDMLTLVREKPNLQVHILNGNHPHMVYQTLVENAQHGTVIRAD